jgi:ADP-heptose:LPS heptosyltransferase
MHLIDQQLNLMIRGRFEDAWKLSEQMEKINPEDMRHKFNRGWFLINQGDLQGGFRNLECGRFLNVYGDSKIPTQKPIWNQEDGLENKVVIINLEGGFGDQMLYARSAKEVINRGGRCILCCDARLHPMLSRCPGVSECITVRQVPTTRHDYWIPGFSASWIFDYTFDTIPKDPYIFANPMSIPLWKEIIKGDKPKVGIRWSGSPLFEHQQFRIFPPEKLLNLAKYKDQISFYSFQRDTDTRELPEEISDLQHILISWEDTAAAISNLDLMITSCTSIAHLSAAMGKPTWVIVPMLPYHCWAYGNEHSPWYPETTRVFRQKTFSGWDETFEELENHLVKHFNLDTKLEQEIKSE